MSSNDNYIPKWEGLIENWTLKYATNNVWRVEPHHDIDDLHQEGYIIFIKVKTKYTDIKEARHFLSLYQRSFINRINDLSKVKSGETGFKKFNTQKMIDSEMLEQRPLIDINEEEVLIAITPHIPYLVTTYGKETTDNRFARLQKILKTFLDL